MGEIKKLINKQAMNLMWQVTNDIRTRKALTAFALSVQNGTVDDHIRFQTVDDIIHVFTDLDETYE